MRNTIKYVGLDVSKEKIAVAIADEGREPAWYYGCIAHTLVKKGKDRGNDKFVHSRGNFSL